MKNRRHPTHSHTLVSLALVVAWLFVMPGVTPAVSVRAAQPAREAASVDQADAGAATPAGLTADEQATMQDLIRQADYQFVWHVSDDAVGAYHAPYRAHGLSLSCQG